MATPPTAALLLTWLAGLAPVSGDMFKGTGSPAHVATDMSLGAPARRGRDAPVHVAASATAPGAPVYVAATMSLGAPARKGPVELPAPAPAPAPAYGADQARADIELVLTGRGRDYIDARARLERSPDVAAPLVAARLTAVPAPTVVEQRRLLALLGGIARPEDVALFADALRRDVAAAVKQSQEQGIELPAAEPWREILRAQGSAAAPALTTLVAEKSFSEELRGLLLGDLVAVTVAEGLPELIGLVGLGAPSLRAALRQAIVRRAHSSPAERALLVQVVDAALAAADTDQLHGPSGPARLAGLVLLRAALGDAGDGDFTRKAAALAEDAQAGFAARVAAVRVLVARRTDPDAQAALARLVDHHLAPDRRGEQRSEILGAIALTGLAAAAAADRVARLQLTRADAPRIAATAWSLAHVPKDSAWLGESQRHPWPEVRAAALARVEGPCPPPLLARLRDATVTAGATFEPEPAVAREALAALGRCGGPDALAALEAVVADAEQGVDRRAEAARQLVDRHGRGGADVVAAALRATDDLGVALRLVRALHRLDVTGPDSAPSPAVREALCAAAKHQEIAGAAHKAARDLFPEQERPCAGS